MVYSFLRIFSSFHPLALSFSPSLVLCSLFPSCTLVNPSHIAYSKRELRWTSRRYNFAVFRLSVNRFHIFYFVPVGFQTLFFIIRLKMCKVVWNSNFELLELPFSYKYGARSVIRKFHSLKSLVIRCYFSFLCIFPSKIAYYCLFLCLFPFSLIATRLSPSNYCIKPPLGLKTCLHTRGGQLSFLKFRLKFFLLFLSFSRLPSFPFYFSLSPSPPPTLTLTSC